MQDEQGFDNNEKVELIEFNYRPLSIQQEVKKRSVQGIAKQKEGNQVLSYLPMKDGFRQEYSQSVILKDQKYVVFNNFNNQIGLQESLLTFSTDFQSSNLELVIKRKYLDYQLYLRPDTNTNWHFQWFYFKVRCNKANKNVTFTIKNFIKSNMLYTIGLKPFIKSNKNQCERYIQLQTDVKYTQNYNEQTFSLKFQYQFTQDGQQVEFCSQPPYPFSRISQKIKYYNCQTYTLCKSLLGKRVPYLVYNQKKPTKTIGIVIARQHPGETIGSWMMEGFMQKLQQIGNDSIQWMVFPMLNVDGVVLGNNRTGISGFDYNRYWNFDELQKKQKYFPELVAFLNIIKNIRRKFPKKIKLFLDLHGHSSQPNVFSYGPPHEENSQNYFVSKIFPQLMSRKNQNFSISQCSYQIKQDKKNTARSLLFNYFSIPFSYTIEGSFGLMNNKNVGTAQFLKIGEDLAEMSTQFILSYILKQKNVQAADVVDFVKEKYKQNNQNVEEYDSDSQTQIIPANRKEFQEKVNRTNQFQISGKKVDRPRIMTQISTVYHKDSEQIDNHFQLFRVQQSLNHRYHKHSQKKRNQTQVTLTKDQKITFLPKIKETFSSRQKLKSINTKEVEITSTAASAATSSESPTMMNIKQIQKRLYRLRNSRIGKKILIINAYGV